STVDFDCGKSGIEAGQPFSVAFWLNTNTIDNKTKKPILGQLGVETGLGYQISVSLAGAINFTESGSLDMWSWAPGKTPINDGKWHHVVAIREPPIGLSVYVDARRDILNTESVRSGARFERNCRLYLGGNFDDGGAVKYTPFSGSIDELGIYNWALTEA